MRSTGRVFALPLLTVTYVALAASPHATRGDVIDLLAGLTLAVAALTLESGILVWVVVATAWIVGLRGVSTRHELTSEWARRGASQSEQYRALTNAIMEGAFGMDVEGMRRYKQLQGAGQNLRDYMSDLELVLVRRLLGLWKA